MSTLERLGLKVLHKMDPEAAHGWALTALRLGLGGSRAPVTSERLKTSLCGLDLPNPIGISAGFDKNAYAIHAALRTGIGFAEIGAATPRAQYGNLKPRLFRLSEDRAVINRFGFNNDGAYAIHRNLTRAPRNGIVGINLGANKTSDDKAADYVDVLTRFHGEVDFATVNVSSPNTEKLRDLQGRAALDALLTRVLEARDALGALPVFLKIAPDLTEAEITDIAEVCLERGIDGIVATNTTLSREGLHSPLKAEAGGMSGPPLFEKSTDVLRQLYRATGAKIPLVGVGGVSTAEHAYAKIRAGASAVQLYTGFVYGGVSLGAEIAEGLDALLARDGTTVADAVGTDA